MIRVMIAEDHGLMREGLKQMLATTGDMAVVAEAVDGNQVFEKLRVDAVDLLMLDMSMPGLSGEDLVARIRSHHPQLRVLVVSMHDAPQIAQRVLRAGANGYITKNRHPKMLFDAIRKVAGGSRYLDPELAEEIAFGPPSGGDGGSPALSDREFQVLRLLGEGLSLNEIAAKLSISNKTVTTHKARMMEKMGFASNAELIRYAFRQGFCE